MKFKLLPEAVRAFHNYLEADKAIHKKETLIHNFPPFISIEITSRCNLTCEHCWNAHYWLAGQDLSLEALNRLESEILPTAASVQYTCLGEPFLYNNFKKVLELIKTYNHPYSKIITNAQAVNPDMARLVLESGLKELTFSVDGATKATYEFIRRGASYQRLISTLDLLFKLKQEMKLEEPFFTFNVVVMEQNLDELEALVILASKYKVTQVFLLNLFAITEEIARRSPANFPERTREALKKAFKRARSLGIEVRTDIDIGPMGAEFRLDHHLSEAGYRFKDFFTSRKQIFIEATPDNTSFCEYPWKYLAVKVNGDVHPCRFLSYPMGNLNEKSFGEIWNSPFYQRLRATILDGSYELCCGSGCDFMASGKGDLKADILILNAPPAMSPGERGFAGVQIKNAGSVEWNASANDKNPFFFDISYHIMNNTGEIVVFDGLRTQLPKNVRPGETVPINLEIQAPDKPGNYRFNIDIVREHVTWFGSVGSPTSMVNIEVINAESESTSSVPEVLVHHRI
ncbi:hypothetical protein ASZ90_016782 [hydrocarbon metagenome]|uniref:Radical SAM core domain-containing protein n=1 Tax=hydrocarbon metagenome TaxID=938273 RepID=A0A0W8EAW9_9ZZZZ